MWGLLNMTRRSHLVLWIFGLVMGLRGANYLINTFGIVKDAATTDTMGNLDEPYNVFPSLDSDNKMSPAYTASMHAGSRHLLALSNCTPRAVEQFPRDVFSQGQRMKGALALHVIGVLYMFLALSIICDIYFVPSLEVLCEMLNLQTDVAGATFMAAGSSAPELATAVIGVFIAQDDVGLSTVVGSAIYNVMFVISACGFAAGTAVPLTWWPMVRDCFAYLVSICALIVVIYDEKVVWYESIVFLVLYLGYIVFMFYNKRLERRVLPVCCCCPMDSTTIPDQVVVHYEKISDVLGSNGSIEVAGERTPITQNGHNGQIGQNGQNGLNGHIDKSSSYVTPEVHQVEEKEESVWDVPSGCVALTLWVVALPLTALMFISMPDVRKDRFRHWFWITFIISLVWLSVTSFFMVWLITIIGYSVSVPDSVMSLTFVAFGVSLPDVVASVLVIKDGLGDMAVSNAVGSNVFDILVCMGIPWCIKTCILNPGSSITVYSEGLLYSSITLLSTVVILVLGIHLNKWKLDKKISVVFLVVYIGFTALTCLYELNVFGYLHPPECPSDY